MALSGFQPARRMSEKQNDFWNWFRSERAFMWRAFVIALIVRLIPVLLARDLSIGLDDMFQYDMLGRSIVSGNGFRWYAQPDLELIRRYIDLDLGEIHYDPRGIETTFRAPLYPAFLALVYFFSGVGPQRFFAARLAQAALGALLVPLTYALGVRLFPQDTKPARWAAWAIAFYPMLVIFPLALATENLFFVLFLGALITLLLAAQTRRTRYFVASGILLGLTALTRSVILSAAILAVVWAWFLLRERLKALALLGAFLVVIAPWIIRNSLIYGHLTPIEYSMGYNLYVGYHPQSTGTFAYGPSLDLLTIVDDAQRERVGAEKAIEFIQADPGRFWYLAVRRLGYFFGLERRALTYFYSNNFFGYIPFPILATLTALILSPFVIVACCAVWGAALVRWNRSNLVLPIMMLGYLAPHVFLLSEDRFHLALVPLFALLAAKSWTTGGGIWRPEMDHWHGPVRRIAISLAGFSILLLFANWGLELYRDAPMLATLFGPGGNLTYFSY